MALLQSNAFMSWATVWRALRATTLRTQIKTDPLAWDLQSHTATKILMFYEAFDIKEGDAMYLAPEERVRIW